MRYSLSAICTESRQHQKVVVRHIWKDALDICEDIRHQSGMKERYQHRKETIERLFRTAKEYHNLRYTREKGKSKMEDKVGLTLACLNINPNTSILLDYGRIKCEYKKRQTSKTMFVFILNQNFNRNSDFFMQIHLKAKGCLIIIY